MTRLGTSPVEVPPLAVGTWAWGDTTYWSFGDGYGASDLVDAFLASMSAGATFFDTAEVYGNGQSESVLGFMASRHETPPTIATKFGLLPGRDARALRPALAASLRRLRRERVDLLQIHWPDAARASIASLMDALADVHHDGLARAVGVSNFGADEMRRAQDALGRHGVPLASNQVRYGLLHRAAEVDGVWDACVSSNVTLLAYSPLDQGVLAGTYASRPPSDRRKTEPWFTEEARARAAPVLRLLEEIATRIAQPMTAVALRFVIDRGAIPIAGAKTGAQASENARALGFRLTEGDLAALDEATQSFRASPPIRWRR